MAWPETGSEVCGFEKCGLPSERQYAAIVAVESSKLPFNVEGGSGISPPVQRQDAAPLLAFHLGS